MAARSSPSATSSICRTMASSTRSASSRPGRKCQGPVNFRGVRIGIPICEDIWGDVAVCETLAESGAEILLVPNGSPYYRAKIDVRHQVVIRQVIECGLPMIYANQLGGQDELIFDGASFAIGADKTLAFQMSQFEETVDVTTWKTDGRRLGLLRRADVEDPREGGGRLPRLHAGPARLRQQERLQECRARPFRRHRFGDLRGACRRCAGRGTAARGDDALSLHLEGLAEGRRGLRPRARLPL